MRKYGWDLMGFICENIFVALSIENAHFIIF
jgi:hypothetical protein